MRVEYFKYYFSHLQNILFVISYGGKNGVSKIGQKKNLWVWKKRFSVHKNSSTMCERHIFTQRAQVLLTCFQSFYTLVWGGLFHTRLVEHKILGLWNPTCQIWEGVYERCHMGSFKPICVVTFSLYLKVHFLSARIHGYEVKSYDVDMWKLKRDKIFKLTILTYKFKIVDPLLHLDLKADLEQSLS